MIFDEREVPLAIEMQCCIIDAVLYILSMLIYLSLCGLFTISLQGIEVW